MRILGIETSCDETAVCIIEAEGGFGPDFHARILGNALYSQIAIHAPYGGVFPNLAKREHAKNLVPLLSQALDQACLRTVLKQMETGDNRLQILQDMLAREPELLAQLAEFLKTHERPAIDAIAVTAGPGLEPALWVGVNFARALATLWQLPLVAVNHMEGHIVMSLVRPSEDDPSGYQLPAIAFPVLSLLISGGHTELVLSREWQQYERIGETRDDAVGEAFDKVARLLGLPYPGGPEISRLAALDRMAHDRAPISFTAPMLHSGDYDFSFSGLKTEVRRYVEEHPIESDDDKHAIARAFEDTVAKVLIAKTMKAADDFGARAVVVGGGVSANTFIRSELANACEKSGLDNVLVPEPSAATDNAVMIALAGYFRAIKGEYADPATLRANGNLRLA